MNAVSIKGHVTIVDDLGNVLLDRDNSIHPQNMARIIARAFSNEPNSNIYRMAFGNGGTQTDASLNVTFNNTNDGQSPDVRTWDSRIYNETYSEVIDDSSVLIGTDPGSTTTIGVRPGGGSSVGDDPLTIPHVSGPGVRSSETGLVSVVTITAVINANEPNGQYSNSVGAPAHDTDFHFDEIGLYTDGAPAIDIAGYVNIGVGNKNSDDDSKLAANASYSFKIEVDGGGITEVSFTTPVVGGTGLGGIITYGDICEAINSGDVNWNPAWNGSPLPSNAMLLITDATASYPTITGSQTFGYLRFTSNSVGPSSTISLTDGTVGSSLIPSINSPIGGTLQSPKQGLLAGTQNDPTHPELERERLLTHLIFAPILKSGDRELTISYSLSVYVPRT